MFKYAVIVAWFAFFFINPVMGLAGNPAPVPTTGQTTSYATGDDGDLEKGIEWPTPRFTDNGDGTVTDNLTGLIWLKNANCFDRRGWSTALSDCNTLNSGECDLSDGSIEGDWRLPNVHELGSLVDYSQSDPALHPGHPFSRVQSHDYWSSTTYGDSTSLARWVNLKSGYMSNDGKSWDHYVWPVRGGQ